MFEKDPRTFAPDYQKLSPEQKAMVKLEIALSNFFKAFEGSVRRWERLVYPAMLIVGILSLSGFYLIYNLTSDMAKMARSIDPSMEANLEAMSKNMVELSRNMATMTGEISAMVRVMGNMQTSVAGMEANVGVMAESVGRMEGSIESMNVNIAAMNQNVTKMNVNMQEMNHHMGFMNQNMAAMNQGITRIGIDMNRFTRPESIMMPFMR